MEYVSAVLQQETMEQCKQNAGKEQVVRMNGTVHAIRNMGEGLLRDSAQTGRSAAMCVFETDGKRAEGRDGGHGAGYCDRRVQGRPAGWRCI